MHHLHQATIFLSLRFEESRCKLEVLDIPAFLKLVCVLANSSKSFGSWGASALGMMT